MLIGVCSDKGSPGATSAALVLASAWPDNAVVVEMDPHGGDLAIRLRARGGRALPEAPTVLSVATAARSNPSGDPLERHAHSFTKAVSVVPGPLSAEQLTAMNDVEPLRTALRASTQDALLDFGRLHLASPLLTLAAETDVLLMVGRADAGSMIRLRDRLARLAPALASRGGDPPRLFPVLVCTNRHGTANVADLHQVLGQTPAKPFLSGAGYLAFDPPSLRRLESGEDPDGRLARRPLLRSAKDVVDQLKQLALDQRVPTVTHLATGGSR